MPQRGFGGVRGKKHRHFEYVQTELTGEKTINQYSRRFSLAGEDR
jgi:hypothetical protein